MIEQPDDSGVTMEAILLPHRQRTIERMRGEQKVLCIQDGTDLNFNSLAQCEGLGAIGKNQTGTSSKGLHLHSTFVVNADGLPLGVLRAEAKHPSQALQTTKALKKTLSSPVCLVMQPA